MIFRMALCPSWFAASDAATIISVVYGDGIHSHNARCERKTFEEHYYQLPHERASTPRQ